MNTTAKKGHARVDVADALRGFSVLAIVLLHAIEHFNFYHFPDAASRGWLAAVDTGVWQSLFFLFSGKAYAIFALLFGFSFFIQHDNQRMRGHDFRLRFCRRLLVLFVIGNINACFFTGEILVTYALVGFVLVLTCRLSDRTLIALGALCLLQPVCLYYTARLLADPSFLPPAVDEGPLWAATFAAQSGGSFLETVRVNLWEGQLASLAYAWNHGRIFQTAGLFIIGMLTGRRGWFLRPALPYWGRALAIAIFCYFPLDSMHASAMELPNAALSFQLGMLLKSLANMCLMVMWVAGIMFAFYCSVRPARVLSALIPYGKLSMTNYVTQGIAGAAIFYHWGLGLQAGVGPDGVDECNNRAAELLRLPHQPQGLAVSGGAWHPEIAPDVLLRRPALAGADDGDGPPVVQRDPAQNGPVLPAEAVAVLFKKVGEQRADIIGDIGPLGVTGRRHPLGRRQFAHVRPPLSWRRSSRDNVSRSRLRGTTASTKPCPSWYSAR